MINFGGQFYFEVILGHQIKEVSGNEFFIFSKKM